MHLIMCVSDNLRFPICEGHHSYLEQSPLQIVDLKGIHVIDTKYSYLCLIKKVKLITNKLDLKKYSVLSFTAESYSTVWRS